MKSGIERIASERLRQINQEGWTPEHDDNHTGGELAGAAACYALSAAGVFDAPSLQIRLGNQDDFINLWPFSEAWWKPSPDWSTRDLEKAGAFCAAEIDRRQRLAQAEWEASPTWHVYLIGEEIYVAARTKEEALYFGESEGMSPLSAIEIADTHKFHEDEGAPSTSLMRAEVEKWLANDDATLPCLVAHSDSVL